MTEGSSARSDRRELSRDFILFGGSAQVITAFANKSADSPVRSGRDCPGLISQPSATPETTGGRSHAHRDHLIAVQPSRGSQRAAVRCRTRRCCGAALGRAYHPKRGHAPSFPSSAVGACAPHHGSGSLGSDQVPASGFSPMRTGRRRAGVTTCLCAPLMGRDDRGVDLRLRSCPRLP
jgi:hypothetical protein